MAFNTSKYRALTTGVNTLCLHPVVSAFSGAVLNRLVQVTGGAGNLLFETDDNGNLVLDALGNPIPVMVTIPVPALMSVNGAHSSVRFFAPFASGGSHETYLDPAELRLISEWLDIGAQYYNNPFDVPQN